MAKSAPRFSHWGLILSVNYWETQHHPSPTATPREGLAPPQPPPLDSNLPGANHLQRLTNRSTSENRVFRMGANLASIVSSAPHHIVKDGFPIY